ncbi:MAG: hypothetical protein ACI4TE_07515 [Alphaproteobacteria bacterium]
MDSGTEKVSVLFRKLFFPTLAGMLSMCAVTAIDGVLSVMVSAPRELQP